MAQLGAIFMRFIDTLENPVVSVLPITFPARIPLIPTLFLASVSSHHCRHRCRRYW